MKLIVLVADFNHDGPAVQSASQFLVEEDAFAVEAETVAFMAVDTYAKALSVRKSHPESTRVAPLAGDSPDPKAPVGAVGRRKRRTDH